MAMFGRLLRHLRSGHEGKRKWSPGEVRELINRGQLADASAALAALSEATPQRDVEIHCLKGEIAFREHRDVDAQADFRAALALAPGSGDAHYGLSLVLMSQREGETALRHAQFAVNSGLTEPRFSAQLGLCQLEMGNYTLAEKALQQATRLAPDDKASWNNLGIAARARGNVSRAMAAFRRALEINPGFALAAANIQQLKQEIEAAGATIKTDSAQNKGGTELVVGHKLGPVRELASRGEIGAAIDACEALCAEHSDDIELVIELNRLYRANGDPQTGLDALEAFRVGHPHDIAVTAELGKGWLRESEFKRAKPLLSEALEALPDDVELLLAMADIREEQNRYADAGKLIERAYAIDSSIHMKGRLASNLVTRCRYDDAIKLIEEMVAEHPSVATDVSGMRVYSLTHLGRHDEALPMLEQVIALHPNDPNKRFPRATIHLLNERFAEGWDDYAYRNLSSTKHLRMVAFPQWRGEPLQGKAILVLAEQGLGDQVMFANCLPDLLERKPARTIVEAIDRVAPTLARSFPSCEVIATKQDNRLDWVRALGHVDYFIPVADLPQIFRRTREHFPHHDGYLQADPTRVAFWAERLAGLGARPKIGVSWRGGTELTRTGLRSMDVAMLGPLMHAVEADYVCLQYGDVKDDLAKAEAAELRLHYWPESIKDLDEFAALVSALDLVITVCNTTVHYAGALGTPVWVMSPKIPEWRYGLYSESLPWYPSSRMYRQQVAGDWTYLIDCMRRDLVARFAAQ